LERDVGDGVARDGEEERQLIAAQRVVRLQHAGGVLELAEVPRPLRVLDDHVLVDAGRVEAHCSSRPARSAWTCSRTGAGPTRSSISWTNAATSSRRA